MLRPWPASLTPSFAVLSVLLGCSSAGTDQLTEASSSGETGGSSLTSPPEPSPTDSGSVPTTGDEPNFTTGDPVTTDTTTGTSLSTTGPTESDTNTSTIGESSTSDSTTDTTAGTTGDTTTDTTGDTSTGTTADTSTDTSSSSTGDPPEGCIDGVQNGDETDVDCGGSCNGCEVDQTCAVDADCASLSCEATVCVAASCEDSKQNGSETDVDCGGDCDADCLDGDSCELGGDCESGVCTGDICQPPACDDNALNGDETDVDCGGSCDGCSGGQTCDVDGDCADGICSNDVCAAGSCDDGIANGGEAGIDCGGPSCAPCELVINEVDYDQVGEDLNEYVEILNKEASPVSLADLKLVVINGSNNGTLLNLSLAAGGVLMPGQYLVVGTPVLAVPPGAIKVAFAKAKDNLENGAPDGVALVDATHKKVLDALSYEGSITMGNITDIGVTNLVEGMALAVATSDSNTAPGSLARLPNGTDTNNAATDWAFTTTPTPGAANVP